MNYCDLHSLFIDYCIISYLPALFTFLHISRILFAENKCAYCVLFVEQNALVPVNATDFKLHEHDIQSSDRQHSGT